MVLVLTPKRRAKSILLNSQTTHNRHFKGLSFYLQKYKKIKTQTLNHPPKLGWKY
jgi:hypothetical protein